MPASLPISLPSIRGGTPGGLECAYGEQRAGAEGRADRRRSGVGFLAVAS